MHSRLAEYISLLLVSAPVAVFGQAAATQRAAASDPIYLIIRTDDVGMSHSVNMGVQKLLDTGFPVSVSEMFACPWYQEAAPRSKADSLVAMIDRLRPGVNAVVTHVGVDDAELGALVDMNTDEPLPEMSKNRQGELDALTSQRFTGALKARNVVLITYRDVITKHGLKAMRRPAG
ncbi:MAG TPA: ChbG/HpnK family deacetylase [Gemmatimonadales bacterium]